MLTMKYIGLKTEYDVEFKKVAEHIVQLIGSFPVKENGFQLSRKGMNDWEKMDYSGFTTKYREIEGGIQFSDDGTAYVAPKPIITFSAGNGGTIEGVSEQEVSDFSDLAIPEPVPNENYRFVEWEPCIFNEGKVLTSRTFTAVFEYVPTLEEVKESKKQKIKAMYQAVKSSGVDVTLSTGTEHFPLTDEDITFLMGKQFEISASESERISYQDSDNHCKFYSKADMQAIIQTALLFVNYQTTYKNNLCEWVDECQTKEEVESIMYGTEIPEEYQNDVYKSYLMKMEG